MDVGDRLPSLDLQPVRVWDGRPLLVVQSPSPGESATGTEGDGSGLQVALDAEGTLRRRLLLDDHSWGLFIADRWGVVYHVVRSPHPSALLNVGEIEEWLRYLATQCPECGVIDEPIPSGWSPP